MGFLTSPYDLVFFIIFFIAHKLFIDLILACNTQKIDEYHFEEDLFSDKLNARKSRVKKYIFFEWLPSLLISLLMFIILPHWNFENGYQIKFIILPITVLFSWKFISSDNDAGTGENKTFVKLVLVLMCLGMYYTPAFLPLFLNVGFYHFRSWQHHNQMPTRILQVTTTALILNYLIPLFYKENYSFISFYATILLITWAMHYWVPFAKKVLLSIKNKKIWPIANDLHFIIKAAQFYGWQSNNRAMDILFDFVRKNRVLLQSITILGEGFVMLMMFNFNFSIVSLCLMSLMHVLIFVCSGILFWEYMSTIIVILFYLFHLRNDQVQLIFNENNGVVFILVSVVFVISGIKLWRPKGLAWWETNLVGKVNWYAIGKSGKKYLVTNNFMSPHEYAFGRFFGDFLLQRPVLYFHLGQVKNYNHKEAISALKENNSQIDQYVHLNGKIHFDTGKKDMHDRYMRSFFANINAGFIKDSIPFIPSWMKAPGGQVYYLNQDIDFNYQEKISFIQVIFTEKVWTESGWLLVNEHEVSILEIPS